MSWTVLLALCAVSYALKAVGPVLAGGRELGPQLRLTLDLVAVPLLAALILVQTLGDGHRLVLDARVPALAVAAVLVVAAGAVPRRRARRGRRRPRCCALLA